ncbi:MAG TPA: magnesium transporter, partial [Solirubrobacterales bacterium]|nr:magnesium transporter [Solirubrobacterales bacterium]
MEASGDPFSGEVVDLSTTRVPTFPSSHTAGAVRREMAGRSFDFVDVVVLDQSRLVGLVPAGRLLEAAEDAVLGDLVAPDPAVIRPGGSAEAAAWRMARGGQSALAVVGVDGSFAGLVPPHALVGRLLAQHDEDAARLGGYLASSGRARLAAEEPVRRRLLHRLPWLLVGLIGAMASAVLVGSFEAELDKKVLLAFFVPAVVYMADAVGTQTETLLIRGMSASIDMGTVIRRELLTGVLIGILIGLAFFVFALIGWGDLDVALAVALALTASCSIATSVATVLPRLLSRLGSDPAFGSGPLATIVQDLLSIAVYLAIATPLAT